MGHNQRYEGTLMSDKRRGDTDERARFRTDRIFSEAGKWYFQTREKTIEGPFHTRADAELKLDGYLKVVKSGYLQDGSQLQMEPTEKP